MKVVERFRWESAHRLPWHTNGGQHLHGHSYVMTVEVERDEPEPDSRPGFMAGLARLWQRLRRPAAADAERADQAGELARAIGGLLRPLIGTWDHATLVARYDEDLQEAVRMLDSKHYLFPFDTTPENLCQYVADYLGGKAFQPLSDHEVRTLRVRVEETATCYAALEVPLAKYVNGRSPAIHANGSAAAKPAPAKAASPWSSARAAS